MTQNFPDYLCTYYAYFYHLNMCIYLYVYLYEEFCLLKQCRNGHLLSTDRLGVLDGELINIINIGDFSASYLHAVLPIKTS